MYKAELKKKYKDLVRQGSLIEAEQVLNQLRSFSRKGEVPKNIADPIEEEVDEIVEVGESEHSDEKVWKKFELESMEFDELREVGYKLGVRGRSKTGLIKDILAVQNGSKEPEVGK